MHALVPIPEIDRLLWVSPLSYRLQDTLVGLKEKTLRAVMGSIAFQKR